MNIINCTPHDINIVNGRGEVIETFKPVEKPARCKREKVFVELDGVNVPITHRNRTKKVIKNLPDPQEGTLYIVSNMVAKWALNRIDLLIPSNIVKDHDGNVIGCKKLSFTY